MTTGPPNVFTHTFLWLHMYIVHTIYWQNRKVYTFNYTHTCRYICISVCALLRSTLQWQELMNFVGFCAQLKPICNSFADIEWKLGTKKPLLQLSLMPNIHTHRYTYYSHTSCVVYLYKYCVAAYVCKHTWVQWSVKVRRSWI